MSIYVDPSGVMSVVTQMKMTADTLDELQRILTPQVQEVLWSGQAAGSSLPGIEQLLWQTQEQMSQFTYLNNIVTEGLRTSASGLTSIAQEAENSIAQLSQFPLNAYNNVSRYVNVSELLHYGIDKVSDKVNNNLKEIQETFETLEGDVKTASEATEEEITALIATQQDLIMRDQLLSNRLDSLETEMLALSPDEPGVEETLAHLADQYTLLEEMQNSVEEQIANGSERLGALFEQAGILDFINSHLGGAIKTLGELRGALTVAGFGLGVLFDLLGRKKLDARTIAAVILGNGLSTSSALIPGVGEVELAIAGVSVGDMLGSGLMKLESGMVHNQAVSAQMQQASGYLDTASKDLNLGHAADDIGFGITDLFTGQWGKAGQDGLHILGDAGNLLQGAALTGIGIDSIAVGSADTIIQNIPFLPSGVKNVANDVSDGLLKSLNDESHFVTHIPQALQQTKEAWNVASSSVSNFVGSLF